MSPAFSARHRADEFDRLVEAAASPAAVERAARELRDLARFAGSLRDVPAIEPRAAFTADLRERLMAAAATELVPAPRKAQDSVEDRLTVRRPSTQTAKGRRQRRLTVAIATLAVLGGTAGTAYASRDALPGDTLYPVKRAIENIQTGFTVSDKSKGTTLLSDADTRLREVHALTARDRPANDDEVRATLETFSSQATQASDLLLDDFKKHQDRQSITHLRDFTAQGITQLSQLQATVPQSAQGALSEAAQTLLLIDQAAQALCPDCGGLGITQIPSSLLQTVADTVGGLTAPKDSRSGGTQTETAPQPAQPSISLPSIDPDQLLPGTVDPTAVLPPQKSSAVPQTAPSTSDNGGTTTKNDGGQTKNDGGQTNPSLPSLPTTSPSTVGGAVNGVLGGVGDTVDGVLGTVGGLLGGTTSGG